MKSFSLPLLDLNVTNTVLAAKKPIRTRSNLFLIGFMGAGKSTTGELLAKKIGMGFMDTDTAIQSFLGMSIPTIFKQYGENFFRQMERLWIQEHLPNVGYVIACGGGLPIGPGMIELLKTKGTVIALNACPKTIWERIGNTTVDRPLLKSADPYETLCELYQQRAAIYAKAHCTISTDDQSIYKVALAIKQKLDQILNGSCASYDYSS
jgi:shikimate kinase